MSHLETEPAILTDLFVPEQLRLLRTGWGSEQSQAAYQASLMRGFLGNLTLPKPDRAVLIEQAATNGLVIDDLWPDFLAVPLSDVTLTTGSRQTFERMALDRLCLQQGAFRGWCTADILFIGQLADTPDVPMIPYPYADN